MREEIAAALEKAPKLCSSDVTLLLQERYETVYEIHNHDAPVVSGLALVNLHPAEDIVSGSQFEKRMDDFLSSDVLKYFGTTWHQFIEQPRTELESMLKKARRKQAIDAGVVNDITNTMNQKQGK